MSINSLTTPCISLTTCGLAAARLSFAVDPSVCIDLTDYFLLYRQANNRYFSPYKRIGLSPRCWGYAGNRLTDGGQICGNYPRMEYFPHQTSENKMLSVSDFYVARLVSYLANCGSKETPSSLRSFGMLISAASRAVG